MKNSIRIAIIAILASVGLTLGAGSAQAYSGDQFYNVAWSVGGGSTTSIRAHWGDGWYRDVAPGAWSPNNLTGFTVKTCWKARNVNTGYDYGPGYHAFSGPNIKLYLSTWYYC